MVEKKDSFHTLDGDDGVPNNTIMSNHRDDGSEEPATAVPSFVFAVPAPPLRADPANHELRINIVDAVNVIPPLTHERAAVASNLGQADATKNEPDEEVARQLQQQQQLAKQERVKCGAGVASGIAGLFMGGPFLALLLGLGTAYAADQPGAAGDVARAVGEVAITAQNKFKRLDDEHRFVEQGKEAANRTMAKIQEVDQQHRFVDRAKEWSTRAYRTTVDYVREHRLIERGMDAVGKAAYWAANKIHERIQIQQDGAGGGGGEATATAAIGSPQHRGVNGSDKD